MVGWIWLNALCMTGCDQAVTMAGNQDDARWYEKYYRDYLRQEFEMWDEGESDIQNISDHVQLSYGHLNLGWIHGIWVGFYTWYMSMRREAEGR